MTVQAALAFLGQARRDEALRARVEEIGSEATFEALAAAGGEAGLDFTAEELRQAHALDWRMRWARYGGGSA